MKHLKLYEEFEQEGYDIIPKEVQDEIKDILVDLTDKGCRIHYYWSPMIDRSSGRPHFKEKTATIIIDRKRGTTGYTKLVPYTINRLKDYLDYIGYDTTDLIPLQMIGIYIHFRKSNGVMKVSISNGANIYTYNRGTLSYMDCKDKEFEEE